MLNGLETIQKVRESQSDTLLAFSTGKDAIAAWLAIRPHFDRVLPYYLYSVPGLEFVEESLDYYERKFDTKITRLPHPSLHRKLNNFVFQPPENCLVIEQAKLPNHSYVHIHSAMCKKFAIPTSTLIADGVRSADSPIRRVAIMKYGTIKPHLNKYHPVWDWKKADLVAAFKQHDVRLPIDYQLFSRTFDGIDLRFLLPLKKHRPADYRKVLEWFPLADLEVFRWECAHGH